MYLVLKNSILFFTISCFFCFGGHVDQSSLSPLPAGDWTLSAIPKPFYQDPLMVVGLKTDTSEGFKITGIKIHNNTKEPITHFQLQTMLVSYSKRATPADAEIHHVSHGSMIKLSRFEKELLSEESIWIDLEVNGLTIDLADIDFFQVERLEARELKFFVSVGKINYLDHDLSGTPVEHALIDQPDNRINGSCSKQECKFHGSDDVFKCKDDIEQLYCSVLSSGRGCTVRVCGY